MLTSGTRMLGQGLILLWVVLCLTLPSHVGAQAVPTPTLAMRRFLLTVGESRGTAGRAQLRYAASDARALRDVLSQLGGVSADDALLVADPTPERLVQAFDQLRTRVSTFHAEGVRTELVFYYSGHSDETGLLLGDRRVSYFELRKLLESLAVDVRIAILDSCASGAITRTKGGVARAPFLYDISTEVRGHAFLTSSSVDEAAQESDRIRGSFFTHYLISGLRGAADESGDRKVTLTEAYRFAFNETLARTGQTRAGAQHPNYDIALAGTGDLVITDLRTPTSELVLERELEGRLFVRDVRGQLVAELYKPRLRRVTLAVPDGRHTLLLTRDQKTYQVEIDVKRGAPTTVERGDFKQVSLEQTTSRGAAVKHEETRPFAASAIPPWTTNRRSPSVRVRNHFGMTLLYDDPEVLQGLQLAWGGNGARERADGVQLAGVFDYAYTLRGVQTSLVFRYADTLYGVQLGLGPNLVLSEGYGVQVAALNWAASLHGAQFGLINVTRDLNGVQVAPLNIAVGRVRGVQIGLFNYADEADVSLAPIGITRKGGVHAQISTGDTALSTIALRLDANYNYTFVAVGWHPLGDEVHRTYSLGAGMGAKAPLVRSLLFLDLDLGVHLVHRIGRFTSDPNVMFQARAMLRYEIFKHFGLFAGPTFTMLVQPDPEHRARPGFRAHAYYATPRTDDVRAAYWPGWVVGLRL